MLLIILLIYFILLIIIEFYFILISGKQKSLINIKDIDNIDKFDISKHKLKLETSEIDIDIRNYVGKFLVKNNYGFFINIDNWNLLYKNKLYEFLQPVNIKIIKFKKDDNIEYLIN